MERVSIDEAYLMVPEEAWAMTVAVELRRRVREELGLPLSVGIGPNKLVAKVTCGKAKPDGVLQVKAGEEASFLAPLPVEELPGVGPRTAKKLGQYGIRTVGDLAQASETWLKGTFGLVQGISLRMKALGQGSRRLGRRGLPKSISRETTFAEDTGNLKQLMGTLRRLAAEVGEALTQQGLMARVVHIKLRYEDFETVSRQTTLALATDEVGEIYGVAAELLRGELEGEARRVRLLGVGVAKVDRLATQLTLFEDGRKDAIHEAIESSIQPLKEKYGDAILKRGVRSRGSDLPSA